MTYPANLDTIVVRHKIVDTGGRPMRGNMVHAVATKRIWATDGSLIPFETTAQVQADGTYEFELPYVDQPGIHNKGVPFQVTEDVPGSPRHYFIAPVLAHGAGPIDATEALVEAPVGYEVKIQAGPVTDEAAAQLLDQDGQFKAALTGTFATHERLVEVATGQEAALTDSAVTGAISAPGSTSRTAVENTINTTVTDPASATAQYLRRNYISAHVIGPGIAGVVGDGVTDDTAAIQTEADEAFAEGGETLLVILPGTYRISGNGIRVRTPLDAPQATLQYHGTGTALTIGDDTTTGILQVRKNYRLPKVVQGITGNWDGTSVGVKLVNLNSCDVYVPHVIGFETGVLCLGYGSGFAYNSLTLGWIGPNHKNVHFASGIDGVYGWANQNTIIGGRLAHSASRGSIPDDPNAAMLIINGNNNTFLGTSMEGANWAQHRLIFDNARYNHLINCRYEIMAPATNFPILYRNGSNRNRIDGGYDAPSIVETFEDTSTGGVLLDGIGAYLKAPLAAAGQSIPNDTTTPITAWGTPVARRCTFNAATGEFTPRPGRWQITAKVAFAGNATGRRMAYLRVGGSILQVSEAPAAATITSLTVSEVVDFNGTQTFRIDARQTSGGDLGLVTSSGYCTVQAEYLGT